MNSGLSTFICKIVLIVFAIMTFQTVFWFDLHGIYHEYIHVYVYSRSPIMTWPTGIVTNCANAITPA